MPMNDVRQEPLVSVLVRSMDRQTLRDALDAVALQTYPQVEVIVANAKGGIHTALDGCCGTFPLRLINNGGLPLPRPAAANALLDAAGGDWLIFLDDDDLMDPEHLEHLVRGVLQRPGQMAAYTGVRVVDEHGLPVRQLSEPYDRVRLWQANFLPIHAVLFARLLVDQGCRFDESFDVYEDWDFWAQIASLADFTQVAGISATYRLVGDSGVSLEADTERMQHGRSRFYTKWRNRIPAAELAHALARAEEARVLTQRLGEARDNSQRAEAAYRILEDHYRTLATDRQSLELDYRALELDYRTLEHGYRTLEVDHLALEAGHRGLEANYQGLETYCRTLETDNQVQRAAFADLEAAYRALEQAYYAILGSVYWRCTAPLRVLRQKMLHVSRVVYRALPVSDEVRFRWRYRIMQTPLGRFLGVAQVTPDVSEAVAADNVPLSDKETVRARAEKELTEFLAADTRLALPTAETPRLSVLLVLYNQAGLTYGCLASLAQERELPFETIIVDNASSDRTGELLNRLDGATILSNADNEGFLLAVNRAARAAKGEFLLLLNNDVVLFPDTLSAAVRRMDSTPTAGAVGGAIILWDGSLQEAGSIIWRDGSCLGYGRGDDPAAPVYAFVRDVDYCSGAFLLVRRNLFEQLGGFDTDYAPAYYEESDFCVRLWEHGYRVLYDPAVRIRHFEFASAGERSESAIALQIKNRERFVAKHPEFLSQQRESSTAAVLFARQRFATGKQRILFVDDRTPQRDLGAGFPRAQEFVQALVAAGHFVTHYPLQFPHDPWDKARAALPESVEIMQGRGVARFVEFLTERKNYYDCMVVSRPHNMIVINTIYARHPDLFAGTMLVYDAEALFSLRDIAKAEVRNQKMLPAEQERKIRDELTIARIARRIITVSETEAGYYRRHSDAKVHVLGHTQKIYRDSPDFTGRHGYLFVGAIQDEDSPNGDSLIWFLREVWPHITAHGEAQLHVVGICEAPEIRRMAQQPGVHLHGRVVSVAPLYDAARVFIVPTRFAAGIPHKAHEAAAHGVPMVVTSLIATQLGWEREVEIADSGPAFAEACIGLHEDAVRWQTKRTAAWDAIERDCSPAVFQKTVEQVVAAE